MEAAGEVTSGCEHETQLTREHLDTEGFGAAREVWCFLLLAFIFIGKYSRAARSQRAHRGSSARPSPRSATPAMPACPGSWASESCATASYARGSHNSALARMHQLKNGNMQTYLTCTRLLTDSSQRREFFFLSDHKQWGISNCMPSSF